MAVEAVYLFFYGTLKTQQDKECDDHDCQTQCDAHNGYIVNSSGECILIRLANSTGNKKWQVQEYD